MTNAQRQAGVAAVVRFPRRSGDSGVVRQLGTETGLEKMFSKLDGFPSP